LHGILKSICFVSIAKNAPIFFGSCLSVPQQWHLQLVTILPISNNYAVVLGVFQIKQKVETIF